MTRSSYFGENVHFDGNGSSSKRNFIENNCINWQLLSLGHRKWFACPKSCTSSASTESITSQRRRSDSSEIQAEEHRSEERKKIDKKYTCSSCSQEQWEQEREREKGIRSEEFSHSKTLITARPSTRWMSSNAIYHRQKERESISRSGMLSDQSRTIRRCERSHYDDDDDDNNHYDRFIWWDIHVAFIITFLVEPSTRPLGLPRRLLLL